MDTNVQKLTEKDPQLVEKFSKMSKEELLEAACGEALDVFDMIERVQLFNEECTISMSKPDYHLDDIRTEIKDRKANDIGEFCSMFIEDEDSDEEIVRQIKEKGNEYLNS
jgi:hypothetical protein